MAATLFFGSMVLPYSVTIVLAVTVRLLITGALHEDGLADFFDGFGGGGNDRERILTIMKDSHIGTYGVLGLLVYMMLLVAALYSIAQTPSPLLDGRGVAAMAILAATPFARMVTALLVLVLPYARREEEAKSKTVYRRPSIAACLSLALQGLPLMAVFIWYTGIRWDVLIFIPCLVMCLLYLLIWQRLRGYTGDCCGAVCLLVELSVYLVVCAL